MIVLCPATMYRKTEASSIGDFLMNELGINISDLRSEVEGNRELIKVFPRLRFKMDAKSAFSKLLLHYQREVQSRKREFILDENTIRVISAVAKQMTLPAPKQGLMLCGNQGNGKTTLAKAIVAMCHTLDSDHHFGQKGDLYSVDSQIITACEVANLSKEENFPALRLLKNKPILVIDDCGEEPREILVYGTPVYPLRELLESRYDCMRFTIITTNMPADELPGHYGWRIMDRFCELFYSIAHTGPPYRTNEK